MTREEMKSLKVGNVISDKATGLNFVVYDTTDVEPRAAAFITVNEPEKFEVVADDKA
jgi:hypothetical protein